MTINYEYGERVPTCDICGEALPPVEKYQNARGAMRESGWIRMRVDGEWEDYCAECQEVFEIHK